MARSGSPSSSSTASDWLDPNTRQVTEFTVGAAGVDEEPAEIAPAPDGSLWFTQSIAGNIARINHHRSG